MNAANHQKLKRSYLEKVKLYGKSISAVNSLLIIEESLSGLAKKLSLQIFGILDVNKNTKFSGRA